MTIESTIKTFDKSKAWYFENIRILDKLVPQTISKLLRFPKIPR